MAAAIASMSTHDLCSPNMNIMHKATITGYMKLIVDAIPLEMLAYPMSKVTEVIALRALRRKIFHPSSNELMRRVFFFAKA